MQAGEPVTESYGNIMRKLFVVVLCVGLIGAAVAVFTPAGDDSPRTFWDTLRSLVWVEGPDAASTAWPTASIDGSARPIQDERWRSANVEPAPAVPLEQALSFAMSIPQILGSWPQVSTGFVEHGLFGYRVPLVSGTRENDITGSLTYFFGPDKVLRRIDFTGDTGDARKLIAHLSSGFGMDRQLADERGVFLYRTTKKNPVTGELRVRPRTIIQATLPHQRFEIFLSLSRSPLDVAKL